MPYFASPEFVKTAMVGMPLVLGFIGGMALLSRPKTSRVGAWLLAAALLGCIAIAFIVFSEM